MAAGHGCGRDHLARSTAIGKDPRKSKIRSVRLNDAKLKEILDRLDEQASPDDGAGKDTTEEYSYRLRGCVVDIQQPGGSTASFLAPTWRLSATGLSFLHGAYVHTGTRCSVQLVSTHNMWQTVEASVDRCKYLEGAVHDVRVRFDEEIDVAMFAAEAVRKRVLLVDDDPFTLRLVSFHLSRLNTEVTVAEDGEAGIAKAMESIYDCILMDLEMPKLDGISAIKQLRAKGYVGIAVAMTAMTGDGDRERCLEAGFNKYLPKPISKEALAGLLRSINEEPLFSTLSGQSGMDELINGFVEDLALRCHAIEEAAANKDLAALEVLARSLKGEAGGYGFEPITEAASALEKALGEDADRGKVQDCVRELGTLCSMARRSTHQT